MGPPKKTLTDADIDELYGLEPVIGDLAAGVDAGSRSSFVLVHCPYCGEGFETSADASGGPCEYVEDCQICCQPIDMELRVGDDGEFQELVVRRGDG
jgi:hypothetical protein